VVHLPEVKKEGSPTLFCLKKTMRMREKAAELIELKGLGHYFSCR
jgi:hypothetical protein